jgi:hypothetical protein
MLKQREATTERQMLRPLHRKRRRRIWLRVGAVVILVVMLASGILYAVSRAQPRPQTPLKIAQSTPVYHPVVGDTHDPDGDDPDISVQQSIIPGFQFKRGGFTLAGNVVDARSGQPIFNAVVWLDLPPVMGQPTSAALHTVTDSQGSYVFQHIAVGSYTLAASRYYNVDDGRYYGERIYSPVMLKGDRLHVTLALSPISAPGKRAVNNHTAKNLIVIDLRGFYANSLLNDPLLAQQTQNLRAFLRRSEVASSLWWPYGWRPLDQYALLTGSYPSWATYDPWPHPVAWGLPDNVDTTFWFTGGRNAHLFGQSSIFDVAKGYGMQTGVVAGSDYITSDATTRNVDVLQLNSSFFPDTWLSLMEGAAQNWQSSPNGFVLYGEIAPLPPGDGASSPDAEGDAYQQGLMQADQTFGELLAWLNQTGLLASTVVALTTSQAQANHTDADNFYGMGSTGQGTSKQTLLAMLGPGVCDAREYATPSSGFVIAPLLMQALGLPAPYEARMPEPFSSRGCS